MDATQVLAILRDNRLFNETDEDVLLRAAARALGEVKNRLRSDADESDPRVAQTAAALARFRLFTELTEAGARFAGFRAGDVTVNRDLRAEFETERALRDEALCAAAPLLRDGGFPLRLSKNITLPFFQTFGRTMTLETAAGSEPFKAFLQPLRYKNKMYLGGTLTEIGYDTLRKFVLICPVSVNIPAVDGTAVRLEFDGDSFCVDHCEKVFFGETPLYYWAVVHQNNDWRVHV